MFTLTKRFAMFFLFLTASQVALASPFAQPDEPSGVVIMNTPHTAHLIYPVRLVRLDGQEIPARDHGVWLKPGTHRLRLVAAEEIDTSISRGLQARQKIHSAQPVSGKELVLSIEAGKKYYVGYDVSDRNPKNWKPVLWQVK